jgi:hypothetical protein
VPLAWWLEKNFAESDSLGPQKTLACANSAHMTSWIAWYRKKLAFAKRTAQWKQGFELKVS